MNLEQEVDEGISELGTGVYVTELGPHDVLLGRGTGGFNILAFEWLPSFFLQ